MSEECIEESETIVNRRKAVCVGNFVLYLFASFSALLRLLNCTRGVPVSQSHNTHFPNRESREWSPAFFRDFFGGGATVPSRTCFQARLRASEGLYRRLCHSLRAVEKEIILDHSGASVKDFLLGLVLESCCFEKKGVRILSCKGENLSIGDHLTEHVNIPHRIIGVEQSNSRVDILFRGHDPPLDLSDCLMNRRGITIHSEFSFFLTRVYALRSRLFPHLSEPRENLFLWPAVVVGQMVYHRPGLGMDLTPRRRAEKEGRMLFECYVFPVSIHCITIARPRQSVTISSRLISDS